MDDIDMEPSCDSTDQKPTVMTKVNGIEKTGVEEKILNDVEAPADMEKSKVNGDDCMSEISEGLSENSRGLENGLSNPCDKTDDSGLHENPEGCNSERSRDSEIGLDENSNSSVQDEVHVPTPSDASGSCENVIDSSTETKTKNDYSDVSQDQEVSMETCDSLKENSNTSSSAKDDIAVKDHSDTRPDTETTFSGILKSEPDSEVDKSCEKNIKDPDASEGEDVSKGEKECNGTDIDKSAVEKTQKSESDKLTGSQKKVGLEKIGNLNSIADKMDGGREMVTKVNSLDKIKSVEPSSKQMQQVASPLVTSSFLPAKTSVIETADGPRILVPAIAATNSLLLPKMSISSGTHHLSSPSLAGAIPQPPYPQQSNKTFNNNNVMTPDKSQSSIDMLSAVKKQVEFGSRTPFRKSKLYDPKGELGPTAKFLFNIGQEVVKDRVYSSMIKIQDKRDEAGKLSDKEKKDLEKLKEIHKDVYHNVKDLILDAKSRCFSCHFTSDLNIVLENHKQYPHTSENGNLCLVCKYTTTTWQELTFHMQLIHNLQPITMKKAAAFECSLCPYENNSKNKLFRHKTSCFKNFQIAQNLAPSWLNNDMNFALTDCFYKAPQKKPITPRPLPLPNRNASVPPVPVSRPGLNIPQQPNLKPRPYLYQYVRNQTPTSAQNYRLPIQPNITVSQTPLVPSGTAVRQNFVPVSVVQPGQPRPKTVEQILNKNRQTLPKPPAVVTSPSTTYKLTDLAHSKSNTVSAVGQTKTVSSVANTAKSVSSSTPVQQTPPQQGLAGFVVCEICGGYVKDRPALKVHLFYAHNISLPEAYFNKPTPPLMCEVCSENFWTIQGLQKHRKVRGHTPGTASTPSTQYCSLCGLRNIKNYVGHVLDCHQYELGLMFTNKVCMFPNCSRIFKTVKEGELHMAAYHGILVRATPTTASGSAQPAVQAVKAINPASTTAAVTAPTSTSSPSVPATARPPVSKPAVQSSTSNVPGQQGKNQVMVRSNECVFCNTKFANNTDLTKHCLKFHYICNACGMVIRTQQDAIKHLCPNKPKEKKCQICKNIIPIKNYRKHLEEAHLKKCSVKVKRLPDQDVKNFMGDSDGYVSESQEFEDYECDEDEIGKDSPPKRSKPSENSIDLKNKTVKSDGLDDSVDMTSANGEIKDVDEHSSSASIKEDKKGVDSDDDGSNDDLNTKKTLNAEAVSHKEEMSDVDHDKESDVGNAEERSQSPDGDLQINSDVENSSIRISPRKRKRSQSEDDVETKNSRIN